MHRRPHRAYTPGQSMSHSEPPVEETVLQPIALAPVFRSQPRVEWTDSAGLHSLVLEGKTLVGSAADVGLVIQDPAVSRLHAELEPREYGLWVRDLGSRNGTFLEALQITGAR